MDHVEFRSTFPTLRMACFPTFTGGDRYRVFIPTTQPMSLDVDEKIKRMLMAELRRGGFCNKVEGEGQRPHGFDMSKITPSSLFYIPCRRPGQATWFADYPGEELDPMKWIENPTMASIFDQLEPVSIQPSCRPSQAGNACTISRLDAVRLKLRQEGAAPPDEQIDDAKRLYRSIIPGAGKRRTGFFVLALKLKRLGFFGADLQMHLISADYDGSRGMQTIRELVEDARATWRGRAAA